MMKNTYTRISWNGQFLLLLLRQVPSAVEHYFNSMDQSLAEISTSGPSARDVTSRNCGTLRLIVSPAAMEGNHSKAVYKVNLTSREPNCQGPNQMQSLIFEMISDNHPCLLNVVLMAKHGETSLHQAGTAIVPMELALRSNSEWFHVFHLSPRCGIKWSVLSGGPMMGTWSDMKNSESSWITWITASRDLDLRRGWCLRDWDELNQCGMPSKCWRYWTTMGSHPQISSKWLKVACVADSKWHTLAWSSKTKLPMNLATNHLSLDQHRCTRQKPPGVPQRWKTENCGVCDELFLIHSCTKTCKPSHTIM